MAQKLFVIKKAACIFEQYLLRLQMNFLWCSSRSLEMLLFLIHVNDLYLTSSKTISHLVCRWFQYFVKMYKDLCQKWTKNCVKLKPGSRQKQIIINIQKSSYMIFTPRNQPAVNTLPKVHISNDILKRITGTKFLDVLTDENLT